MNTIEATELLKHVPKHSRTSCSDDHLANGYTTMGRGGYPRCVRCALMRAADNIAYADHLTLTVHTHNLLTDEYEVNVCLPNED